MSTAFTTIRSVGGLLPPDLLARVLAGDSDLPGLRAGDYHLGDGESVREAANRAWSYLTGTWASFTAARKKLSATDPAVGLTREKWLALLFRELGYGRLPTAPAGGLSAADTAYPVSHLWERTPIHLLGWGVDLDRRTPGVPGAAGRAPHALVQELLNRSDDYLWGVLSNGRTLRLLRDSTSLVGQSYLEFDLEAMFDGEVFSDFVVLYMLVHQSRVEPLSEGAPASECWLERWRTAAVESGTRALGLLRDGVQDAIEALGTGFLRHPDNGALVHRLSSGELRLEDYHRALLRLVYRLLFLFVAEDRDALLDPHAEPLARSRYRDYFATARLRRLATRRRGTRHGDLWQALTIVMDGLGREGGLPALGLPALGGLFERGPADVASDLSLANESLLTAIRRLAVVQPKGQPRRMVDYRHLGAEELGSIYESLLELIPRVDAVERTFTLENLAGNDRKTSGSYYTPAGLIDLVLDTTLDPLLDSAERSDNPEEALLNLTVCDPACGSGHFLVAAARRIAQRLATVRGADTDPSPTHLKEALHDVIAQCIYGVDLNPMAAELAKVSLWIEALRPGHPLSFLDAHIKVGNSLLATTPALLAAGIPDIAFTPIEGDDKKYATALRKRNATERDATGQGDLFDVQQIDPGNQALSAEAARITANRALSLGDVHLQASRFAALESSPGMRQARFTTDAWCAAFVQHKSAGTAAITHQTLTTPIHDLRPEVIGAVDTLAAAYRFFHWHLEFPDIFSVPDGGAPDTDTGWHGGFACVIGNPPWERVKIQEKEFFASRDPQIAAAGNAASRKKLIKGLAERSPALLAEFQQTLRTSEGQSHFLRNSGHYPLTGRGDVNTYSVFAETMRTTIRPDGRMGIITPTGLATDATTARFFAETLSQGRLAAFYDFENEAKIFPSVHNQFRFAVTSITGGSRVDRVRFAFYTRFIEDVPQRRFELAPEEVLLLNPNTGTLPVFRSRADAEITLGIYRRQPVLIRDGDPSGNPWGLAFTRLFDMANDSEIFSTADQLAAEDAQFDGWAWNDGERRWLPLYEAKLLFHYDHRYSTYADATQAHLNKGTLPKISLEAHDSPAVETLTRYWLPDEAVTIAVGDHWDREWFLGWRDITNASNERTFVPSVLPRSAVGHVFPIAFPANPDGAPLLQATWSSLVCDYVARQKLSGTHMTYGIMEQLACPAPKTFASAAPWDPSAALADFIKPRVLELTYTSYRIAPYAHDLGDDGPPFRWIPNRREVLKAELDAAMFHIYGLDRPEVEHVLDSFFVVRKYDERDHGEFRTKRLVLERYDAMQEAVDSGTAYRTQLDPPPGHGPRHETRSGSGPTAPASIRSMAPSATA
ncbi:N-6 DNA methylase [Georgenia sp. EYE_87]|uniref:Eco57I restriction-modification methylase domain-containing protein n=1 Tax=Georgenia sp. EYE_87 TaxID=2853448 RepID=UPI0020037614|nr:N-6 DNA methylase [Georgenia sp. EYE_87]MCK6211558.1 N-6 DNA methylase [Georgenia sp. EYE_87]